MDVDAEPDSDSEGELFKIVSIGVRKEWQYLPNLF